MKTRITEKIYSIEKIDESGLIPQEAVSAKIEYDKYGPKSVCFGLEYTNCSDEPTIMKGESIKNYIKRRRNWIEKKSQKINPTRTRGEVIAIVNALEKALE